MPEGIEQPWFGGAIRKSAALRPVHISAEASADQKSEVIEALRWARRLLSTGQVKAQDIAIAATSTQDWDDHFLAYARSAALPVHFSHGVPALSTADGQTSAALADILGNGLTQERVWRLIRRLPARPFASSLPEDWFAGIPRGAALRTLDQWREAMTAARSRRAAAELAEQILLPILELLSRGPDAGDRSRHATIERRQPDDVGRGVAKRPAARNCAVATIFTALQISANRPTALFGVPHHSWCRARDRSHVCLASLADPGHVRIMTTPLIPHHMLERRKLHPVSTAERDRLHFEIIRAQTREATCLVARSAERQRRPAISKHPMAGRHGRSRT